MLATNEQAEDNARHRNNEKKAAQDPEEEVTHAAPALSRMASTLAVLISSSNASS